MGKFDLIAETTEGNHILLGEASNRQYGAIIGEAIYYHYKDAPPSSFQVRYVWLRDMSNPAEPHLMDSWPEYWKDHTGHQASVTAWKSSPRGVSGDESEPDETTARQAIETTLARLPERYNPLDLTFENKRFTLYVDHGKVFRDQPAREAIKRAQDYVDEHERSGWSLPTGVVYGIYD